MQAYHVSQREVEADVYTHMGWIKGTFHIGENHSFIDSINQTNGFFRLTKVTLPGSTEVLPFFALQRDKTIIILPHDGAKQVESARATFCEDLHQSKCLLDAGTIIGEIYVLPSTRLSDHLVHQGGFFLMQNCSGDFCRQLDGGDKSLPVRYVIVNSPAIIGVTE